MEVLKINGLILKKNNLNDSDVSITVLSKEYGKLNTILYGIRKSKKRNLADTNPLNFVELTLNKKNNFYIVKEIDLIKNFKNIIKDIEKLEISLYILDSINRIYDFNCEENSFLEKIINIFEYINMDKKLKKGYKYYLILSFLRRIMIEQGIYEIEEFEKILGLKMNSIYKEVVAVYKKNNKNDIEIIQNEIEKYSYNLKKIILILENYINENLQVKIDMQKFLLEGRYASY